MPDVAENVLPDIIIRLMELGRPYRPPNLEGCPPAADCFIGPEDPAAAAADLVHDFGEEAVRACGLLDDLPVGGAALAPAYSAVAGPLIAVTRHGESKPFGLVGARGTLPAGKLPLELMLEDGLVRQQLLDSGGLLLLTMPGADAAVFRACGVPAAPCQSPATMSPSDREVYFELLRKHRLEPLVDASRPPAPAVEPAPREPCFYRGGSTPTGAPAAPATPATAETSRTAPLALTPRLPGWSPLNWSPTHETALRNDVVWYAAAERLLATRLGGLAVWLPSAAEQEELAWLLRHGAATAMLPAVLRSVAESSFEIAHVARPDFRPPGPATNFAAAHREFLDAVAGDYGEAPIEEARAQVRRHVQRQLVQPLNDLALASNDPLMRVRYAMAAEEAAIAQSLGCAVHSGLARRADDPLSGLSADAAALLREYGKSADRTLRLHKSLT